MRKSSQAPRRKAQRRQVSLTAGGMPDIVKRAFTFVQQNLVSGLNRVREYVWGKQNEQAKKLRFAYASRGDALFVPLGAVLKSFVPEFCEGLDPGYVNDYIRKEANLLMVGFEGPHVMAFVAAVEEIEDAASYIGIICSKPGNGGITLRAFLDRADDAEVTVTLDAVTNAIGFYARPEFGFSFVESCGVKSDIEHMDQAKARPLKDFSNYRELLEELYAKGFAAHVDDPGCARRDLTLDEIVENSCDDNGYTMTRCARARPWWSRKSCARRTRCARNPGSKKK